MNLLFIQGGSRLKLSDKGLWYTDSNFTMEVWERYMAICDHLTILLRREGKIYTNEECIKRFNAVPDCTNVSVVPLDDFMASRLSIINPFLRKKIYNAIYEQVKNVDKIIIRSVSEYTVMCMEICKTLNKKYLLEVTGFPKESYQNHSLIGKLMANRYERMGKELAHYADAAIYVTDEALQKRYPCKKMLGCSDVVLQDVEDSVLDSRIRKIKLKKSNDIIKIGTAAFLDVKWKGQRNVIRAIAVLKNKGITNIQYEMIGTGNGHHLIKLAEQLGISNQIKVLGAKPHKEVFDWLDEIDIYIQPSYQEGLCRAIIEAISRGCPVIASNAGGNYELINNEFIFPCGNYKLLAFLIEKMIPNCESEAKRNFTYSKRFAQDRLDTLRNSFLREYIYEKN